MTVPLRERTLGQLLSLTVTLCMKHFWQMIVITVLFGFPSFVLSIIFELKIPVQTQVYYALGVLALQWILGPLAQGSAIAIVSSSFTGESVSLRRSIQMALQRFWGLFGYGLSSGFVIMLGMLLLIVPGLMFLTWYYVGGVALVLENHTVARAMDRSKALSDGSRWKIFWYFVLMQMLLYVVTVSIAFALGLALRTISDSPLTRTVSTEVITLLGSIIGPIGPVVLYFQLRTKKEGLDVTALSQLVREIGARNQ